MWSSKILIYTIIIVAFSTYLVVSNLNNIVTQSSRAYEPIRRRLISSMRRNPKHSWNFWPEKGERFDVFTPRHEKAHPSEWWIVFFFFVQIWRRTFAAFMTSKDNEAAETRPTSNAGSGWSTASYVSSSRWSSIGSSADLQPEETTGNNANLGDGVAWGIPMTDSNFNEAPPIRPHGEVESNIRTEDQVQGGSPILTARSTKEHEAEPDIVVEPQNPNAVVIEQQSPSLNVSLQSSEISRSRRSAAQRLSRIFRRKKKSSGGEQEQEAV